jgi:hypothetical protein
VEEHRGVSFPHCIVGRRSTEGIQQPQLKYPMLWEHMRIPDCVESPKAAATHERVRAYSNVAACMGDKHTALVRWGLQEGAGEV